MKFLAAIKGFFARIGDGIKNFFADIKKRTAFIIVCVSVVALTLIGVLCFHSYVSDYYEADYTMISNTEKHIHDYALDTSEEGVIKFKPNGAKTGLIFYPGGKVDFEAYYPLMDLLAHNGILCVLIEMPYNLAVLDVNAADGIIEQFPQIESWYIGGHSLGGSMAASYLKNHKNEIDGLLLLGSYSTADLTDSRVLSVYGSEDRVMNYEKYLKYKENLPEDFTEVVIDGGNHSGFGMYGHQEGDGYAKITNIEQIEQTTKAFIEFINN